MLPLLVERKYYSLHRHHKFTLCSYTVHHVMEITRNCSITKIGVSSIQRFSQAEGSIKNAPTSLPFETDCGTIHIAAARVSNKRTDTKQVMFEKHALATFNPIRHTTHSESDI